MRIPWDILWDRQLGKIACRCLRASSVDQGPSTESLPIPHIWFSQVDLGLHGQTSVGSFLSMWKFVFSFPSSLSHLPFFLFHLFFLSFFTSLFCFFAFLPILFSLSFIIYTPSFLVYPFPNWPPGTAGP